MISCDFLTSIIPFWIVFKLFYRSLLNGFPTFWYFLFGCLLFKSSFLNFSTFWCRFSFLLWCLLFRSLLNSFPTFWRKFYFLIKCLLFRSLLNNVPNFWSRLYFHFGCLRWFSNLYLFWCGFFILYNFYILLLNILFIPKI